MLRNSVLPVGSGAGGGAAETGLPMDETLPTDEKYSKRRIQRRLQERLRQAILFFITALVVLAYTWNTLASTLPPAERSNPILNRRQQDKQPPSHQHDDEKRRQHPRSDQRKKARQQEKEQQQQQHRRRGLFDKVLGRRNPDLEEFEEELKEMDQEIIHNINRGIRWIHTGLLPALSADWERPLLHFDARKWKRNRDGSDREFMQVKRLAHRVVMDWENDVVADGIDMDKGPKVDFTKHEYKYPKKLYDLPPLGEYPKLKSMKDIMEEWPQDDIDHPPKVFEEVLIHFDYTNPEDMEAATLFRDAKLPFKLVNVPEVVDSAIKWTDEYLIRHFDEGTRNVPRADGGCQESPNNFFSFFTPDGWAVEKFGIPPTRNNDWTFAKWNEHAQYADAVRLSPNQPHFYWQCGVSREERHRDKRHWTFISRDLPSFSSPTETFFVFEPESQKGIQCRFGERGVTAATHFDSGRNMIAMIKGAKRYILSPPKECPKLGIVTNKGNPVFRHSILNFGHLNEMSNVDMPPDEHEWLERSGEALAIDTVLKAGEVLYIPSHWFHYITSLQRSAQCNVRSGIDIEGDSFFGGRAEVSDQCEPY